LTEACSGEGELYREVDAASGFASAAGRRRLRPVDVVRQLAVVAVEDEPASTPRADAAAHLDEEPGGAVRRHGDVGGAADDEVSGLLDEREQVERLTAHWQVASQRPRLRPHTQTTWTRRFTIQTVLDLSGGCWGFNPQETQLTPTEDPKTLTGSFVNPLRTPVMGFDMLFTVNVLSTSLLACLQCTNM